MMEKTFREKAIEELISARPNGTEDSLAFLSAVIKQAGSITVVRKRINLVLNTDSYVEAMYVVGILKDLYPAEFEINADEIKAGAKKGERTFTVSIPMGFTKQTLSDTGLIPEDESKFEGFENGIPARFVNSYSARNEYLRGLFLSCGGVYVPSLSGEDEKREGYHLEFRFDDEDRANAILSMLAEYGINSKINERGVLFLVYIKDKDEILKLLGILGLGDSVLSLSRIIEERETANSLNRAVICETANLDKTFVAASKQLLAIGMIEDSIGLDSLSPVLRETARARMEYPQASLMELADILGITKSCLNHRLRKLTELADENGGAE